MILDSYKWVGEKKYNKAICLSKIADQKCPVRLDDPKDDGGDEEHKDEEEEGHDGQVDQPDL